MEPVILVLTLLSLLLAIFIFMRKSDDSKLPPGSFGWPILGETVEFLFGKPEKFVMYRMQKYSPYIFKTTILGEKTAVLCGPEGHKFLFTNEQKLFTAYRPHSIKALFQSYNKTSTSPSTQPSTTTPEQGRQQTHDIENKVLRQPGFFKPEALMRYLGPMDAITQQQLKIHWEGKHQVKANSLSKTITLTLACQFFMGINNPERIARFVTHFDNVTVGMHSLIINFPGTVFYRAKMSAEVLRKELLAVIEEKKEAMAKGAPMHDMLSHIIVMKDADGNSSSDVEVAGKIMGLIVAGYSTLATTMTFFIKYVGLNPDICEKIRSEQSTIASSKKQGEFLNWEDMRKMKYSWNVVCETMRHVPPIQGTFREALTDITYAGYIIPKGWKVYWTVSSTNMNPLYFSDPEKFNPSRYEEGELPIPYTYVPFGGGPRLCPGKEYARLAILTFVHNVVMKYKWDVLYPNEKVTGDMMPTLEKGLPIRLHPY